MSVVRGVDIPTVERQSDDRIEPNEDDGYV